MKRLVMGLGIVAALLILLQLGLGLTILSARSNPALQANYPRLLTAHQHNGFASVAVAFLYIAASLVLLARTSTRREP